MEYDLTDMSDEALHLMFDILCERHDNMIEAARAEDQAAVHEALMCVVREFARRTDLWIKAMLAKPIPARS